ncbi:MazG nucleotide pyrophosphohydrolase domain-containing protein [Erysipelothrix sp. HDW6C]|uniref:MazG nucleotide pyrophosphohydrolase domain-containing protein n=1 Tax=Erysipelothrix sp. HDW6C TaxID=2714930 RepID=UPI001F10D49C|nr:MazG nucleotide pyrophosphohydrolase domain-containing protein [Erysipelothrix sp. HDW6C]
MRTHFGWDETDTIDFMVNCVLEESQELKESLNESEAAFKAELADVLMYVLSICYDRGYDVETIINNKIAEVMKREY